MRRGLLKNTTWTLIAFGLAIAVPACGSSEDANGLGTPGQGEGQNGGPGGDGTADGTPQTPEEQVKEILDSRKVDYGEAARSAKLKLADELPTLEEIKTIEAAGDEAAKKVAYEALIDKWVDSPRFALAMVKFWKDTFRTGQVGAIQQDRPDKDKAANFAAQVVVEGRSYTESFTAADNTCPTFDAADNTFQAGSCTTNPTAGVLTDPGLQAQYFSNMAFRRTRFIQETFACSKFPAEYSAAPVPMGNGTYTGKFEFKSIMGKELNADARVDFHDTSAVICANCHSSMNHITPLFLNYDENGALQTSPQVEVPIPRNPMAAPSDYLPEGEGLAWRFGTPITDIPSLGAAMAADPEVAKCAVNRVWNYAFSRGDIVNDLATIPDAVTAPLVQTFTTGGYKLKDTIRAVFKGEDFVRF